MRSAQISFENNFSGKYALLRMYDAGWNITADLEYSKQLQFLFSKATKSKNNVKRFNLLTFHQIRYFLFLFTDVKVVRNVMF